MATRRERVVLDVESNAAAVFARDAAAAKLLGRSLNDLSGSAVSAGRSLDAPTKGADRLATSSRKADQGINQLTGRLRLFADVGLILGPAFVPITAVAIPAVITLATELGALAGAIGVTVLATKGLGDGLKALDEYQLEPTAENFAKFREEMQKLGPTGANFVRFLDSIEPELKSLQTAARNGLLPGAQDGIETLLTLLPDLRKIIRSIAQESGDLFSDASDALAGPRFEEFFEYLKHDGIKILDDTGRTAGYLAETFANLFVAFSPTSMDMSGGLLEWSRGLAEASADLESNAGFQEFLGYIADTGPQVLDTLAALGDALLQIVEAGAPLGGPVLKGLEIFAEIIGTIADSDMGTPIVTALAALALFNRTAKITDALMQTTWGGKAKAGALGYATTLTAVTSAQDRARMSAQQLAAAEAARNRTIITGAAKAGLAVGGLAIATSGLADDLGLGHAASLAMMGTLAGPWGVAIGGSIGLVQDFAAANDDLESSLNAMNAAASSGDLDAYAASIANAKSELENFKPDPKLTDALTGFGLVGLAKNKDTFAGIWGNLTGANDDAADSIAENEKRLAGLRDGSIQAFDPVTHLATAIDTVAKSAQMEAEALQDSVDAMREKRSEALRGLSAELNYQAAIDDATQSIKDNGKNFDISAEKGRANRQALYALAEGWNQQSDAAKNAQGSLKAARANFIETAVAMGASAAQAKRLADRLFEIKPKNVDVDVDVNGLSEVQTLNAALSRAVSKTITLTVNRVGAGLAGLDFANGGYTGPGGMYEPRGIVHAGEVVIPQRYVRRDFASLKARYPDLPGFADGGLVRNTYTSRRGSDPDEDKAGGGKDEQQQRKTIRLFLAGMTEATHGFKAVQAVLKKEEEQRKAALDRIKSERDAAVARRDQIASGITSGLAGDIWADREASENPWAAGATAGGKATPASALQALQEQRARTQRFLVALNTLKQKGITGPVLLEIIGTGDVDRAEMMAALPIEELASFSSVYNAAQTELAAAGLAGGNALEGQNIRVLEKELKGARQELREIRQAINASAQQHEKAVDKAADKTGEKVKQGVNGGATKGRRNRTYAR